MRTIILLDVICFLIVSGQEPCSDGNSIELKNANRSRDSFLEYGGVSYPPDQVYTRNVSGEIKTFGCVCNYKKCFRKCCPLGKVFLKDPDGKKCINSYDVVLAEGLNVSYINNFKRRINLNDTDKYVLFEGLPCGGEVYMEDRGKWFVQEVINLSIIFLNVLILHYT